MTPENKSQYLVPNLEKGLEILELLANNKAGLTQKEILQETGFSQTTIFRITLSLQNRGYVLRDEDSKKIFLSKRMLSIGLTTINEDDLPNIAGRYMRGLRDEIKETICLGVLGDGEGVFLHQVIGKHLFNFSLSPGKKLPLHAAAPCKAMIAMLPDRDKKDLLDGVVFHRYNSNTITTASGLEREFETIRASGVAFDHEEEMRGVVCASAPIFDHNGYPVAAIWFSGPTDRISTEQLVEYGDRVKHYAGKISFELGYHSSVDDE